MRKKRGQVSLEYVMIVGFALMMLMPIFLIYSSHKQSITTDVHLVQAGNIANKIADNADRVHYMGEPSKTTIEVRMPERIKDIHFRGKSIIFEMKLKKNTLNVTGYSDVNLTGELSPGPGLREITVEALENAVNITD